MPEASAALNSRDLALILRTYRRLSGISQERLAAQLGYDKTYISMIETRRRFISDVASRRHIARSLSLPPHALGVTDTSDADFVTMLQFGQSAIRLAELARQSGRAVEAVTELWPLVARLEALVAAGHVERDVLFLLAHARTALGVSLGTVLPEERLAAAARWTGKGLAIAERFGDQALLAHALRMHGNELRKAGRLAAAVARLGRAAELSHDREGCGTAYALLARAAGDLGDQGLFDGALAAFHSLLAEGGEQGVLFNAFTYREVHLRGLISTGRSRDAVRLMDGGQGLLPSAPQWQVIERVTVGEVHLAGRRWAEAEDALRSALAAAEARRLPHQIQRAVRIAERGGLADIGMDGRAALQRLRDPLPPAELR